jgi:hypothetical protein
MKLIEWIRQEREKLASISLILLLFPKWKGPIKQVIEVFDAILNAVNAANFSDVDAIFFAKILVGGIPLPEWWYANRASIALLSQLWFIPAKIKKIFSVLFNTFDAVYPNDRNIRPYVRLVDIEIVN